MDLKFNLKAFGRDIILKSAISVGFVLGFLIALAMGQIKPQNEPGELYAGIELSDEAAKAIALRITKGQEGSGLKLIYSEIINLTLVRNSNGNYSPQEADKAGRAVQQLLIRLRQQYQVPAERIYLIGSSGFENTLQRDLENSIKKITGKAITFLDVDTEIQLSIVGTIPQRERVGDSVIDNRNSSLLIDIGNHSTRAGYQLLRYSPTAQYDFVTMNIPQGTVSFVNEISRGVGETADWLTVIESARTLGAASLREALRRERESKPGFLNRKRVYLTGGIAWAMATLLYPGNRQNFVLLKPDDIALFAGKAARDPQGLLNPNLVSIRDNKARLEADKDLKAVRNYFRPQHLIAGAEMLKTFATELNWQEKKIWFARFGQLSCISSYVRLQAGK